MYFLIESLILALSNSQSLAQALNLIPTKQPIGFLKNPSLVFNTF